MFWIVTILVIYGLFVLVAKSDSTWGHALIDGARFMAKTCAYCVFAFGCIGIPFLLVSRIFEEDSYLLQASVTLGGLTLFILGIRFYEKRR
jgi:hypothetical protein